MIKHMEFNVKKFAEAATFTVAILYIVCVLVVWAAPAFAMQLLGAMMHIVNVDKYAGDVKITLGGVIVGLIELIIYTYVATLIFATLYNKSVKR